MVEELYQAPRDIVGAGEPMGGVDRSGRIKGMGVLQIILGALAALFGLFSLLGAAIQSAAPQLSGTAETNPLAMLLAVGVYLAVAVFFLWLGIGSIRCRRWSRPLVLALMWPMLLVGAVSFAASAWIIPVSMELAFQQTPGAATTPAFSVRRGRDVAPGFWWRGQ